MGGLFRDGHILAGIKFGALLEKGGKSKSADTNLAVTRSTKIDMMSHSTRKIIGGFKLWCARKTANPPNLIRRQYFQLYGRIMYRALL